MKSDLELLQGTWKIESLEVDGEKMHTVAAMGAKIVVKGDLFTTVSMGADYSGLVELDASKTPKTFDLNFKSGPHAGQASLGIYELDGDAWKICLGFAGMPRPKGFVTSPGSGHALETLTRYVEA